MTKKKSSLSGFLAPNYWPTWLVIGLLRILVLLPFAWQIQMGKYLGRIMFLALPAKRHIAATNLQLCYPELSATERRTLLKQTFQSTGIAIFEMGMAWWRSASWLQKRCQVSGLEHLEAALNKGNGAILLTGHSTALEMGARLISLYVPIQVMYRKASNRLMNAIALRAREANFVRAIGRRNIREMLRGLKENLPSWYAPDQDFGRKRSLFADFMGVSTATVPATAKLAKLSGAAVIPFFPIRLDANQGYELRIFPALQNYPSGDDIQDAREVNRVLERQVAAAPEQYMWVHRRFKTRPPGEAPVY